MQKQLPNDRGCKKWRGRFSSRTSHYHLRCKIPGQAILLTRYRRNKFAETRGRQSACFVAVWCVRTPSVRRLKPATAIRRSAADEDAVDKTGFAIAPRHRPAPIRAWFFAKDREGGSSRFARAQPCCQIAYRAIGRIARETIPLQRLRAKKRGLRWREVMVAWRRQVSEVKRTECPICIPGAKI